LAGATTVTAVGRWRRRWDWTWHNTADRARLLSAEGYLIEGIARLSAVRDIAEHVVTWRPGQLPIGQTAKAQSGCRVQSLQFGRDRQYEISLCDSVRQTGQNRPSLQSGLPLIESILFAIR